MNRKFKYINETFTEAEHEALLKAKGKFTWHDFIMKALRLSPRVIGKFDKGDAGICAECDVEFPIEEMGLIATKKFGVMFEFKLYCYNCLLELMGGDDTAWIEGS